MGFKEKLVSARKRRQITQQRIAKRFRITPQAVSGWERGDSLPELGKIPTIAEMLEVPTDWLLSDGDDDAPELGPDNPWPLWQQLGRDQREFVVEMLKNLIARQGKSP